MNRAQFLRRSLLFSLAAAGLPKLANAFQVGPGVDKYSKLLIKSDNSQQQYSTRIIQPRVLNPDADYDITVVFVATLRTAATYPAKSETHEGRYTLKRVGAPVQDGNYSVIKWKVMPKHDGEDVLAGRLQETLTMKLNPKKEIIVKLSDTDSILLKYNDPNDDSYDDCFLTTACTAARGLPDDCRELTLLRTLRDTHMKPTTQGAAMIAEYYRVAPGIVQTVNTCSNKAAIWDAVYVDLVLPVALLVQAGRMNEAVTHYAEYTEWMKVAFGDGQT